MSVTSSRQRSASELVETLDAGSRIDAGELHPSRRRSRLLPSLIGVGLLATVLLVGYLAASRYTFAPSDSRPAGLLTHEVKRGDLMVTVTEDGTLESADNVQIKCEVAGGSTILSLIADGTRVQQGDVLARLDSSAIEESLNLQKIACEKAQASYIQATKDFEVGKISVREYLEGTYVQQLQDFEATITIALENLRSAENTLQYTERMFRKGYSTVLQRDAQEFAVRRASLELKSAETAKKVLADFTKQKMLQELESLRDAAEARMKSEKAALDLEEIRLTRLKTQLEKCVLTAPKSGLVIHANDLSRRRGSDSSPQIEEGASVRENQDVFRLPDLSKMQVKTAVHESKIEQLRSGMPANVKVQDRAFTGSVVYVANQPEPTSFFSSNVKQYATTVRLDGEHSDLRPGMTTVVEILIDRRRDVLLLPVAAVVEQEGDFFCWVDESQEITRRPLTLGLTDNRFIEVTDGVAEGDVVVLNPRAMIPAAREQDSATDGKPSKSFGSPGSKPPTDGTSPSAPAKPESSDPGQGTKPPVPNLAQLFSKFDSDGDGRLSSTEAPPRMAERFGTLDTNGDGFLDRKEMAAAGPPAAAAPAGQELPGGGM